MDDRPRRKKKPSSGNGGSRSRGGGADGSEKKKKKKKPTSAEDALEAKMRAKSKREKNVKVEDALEEKIRRKNEASAAAAAMDEEEEKVEEGYSVDDYDDYDREMGYGDDGVASGVPVSSGGQPAQTDEDGNELFTRGGGDVRNRPPQQKGAPVLDPLRQAEIEKEKNKKKMNPKFADLHETGQWGGLTKWEKYGICVLVLGAVAAAIVLGLRFGRNNTPDTDAPTGAPTGSPSKSPSESPTMAPTDAEYRATFGLELMIDASPKLTLPQTPGELKGAKEREASTPQELAAEYILYDDPLAIAARDPRFLERYALAVFYYQCGGCSGDWNNRDNWMNGLDHCGDEGWHGVICDLQKRVIELNPSGNYVTGKIPVELGQLMELKTLDLSNNAMVGTVPAEAMSMRKMYTISLNNNMLTGDFPFDDVKKGAIILDNLWIQENPDLGGTITEAYCQMFSVTLDCDNFDPQPTYPSSYRDESLEGSTTFEVECIRDVGRDPTEYTCNFDPPEPFEKDPPVPPIPAPGTVCGTPAAGS